MIRQGSELAQPETENNQLQTLAWIVSLEALSSGGNACRQMRIGLLGHPVRKQGGVQHQGMMKYRVKFLGFTFNEHL